jgi:hypothetical protein
MAPSENYEIGSSSSTTNVESLTTPLLPPRSTWQDYSQDIELASGAVRGAGWEKATWNWNFLTQAQRTQLRTFCSGKSATVWIRTKDNSGAFVYKTGTMVWPTEETRRTTHVLDFSVEFRNLETFTP